MGSKLTDEIIIHILSNLGVLEASRTSIRTSDFLLREMIELEEDNQDKNLKLWGAETQVDNSKLKLILTEINHENEKEYILLSKLDDCPSYGCYLLKDSDNLKDGTILFSLKNCEWLATNIYLQATFLSGMEQLKESLLSWNRLSEPKKLILEMRSLIDYLFMVKDEG
jgi:hypothetical protein